MQVAWGREQGKRLPASGGPSELVGRSEKGKLTLINRVGVSSHFNK